MCPLSPGTRDELRVSFNAFDWSALSWFVEIDSELIKIPVPMGHKIGVSYMNCIIDTET